MDSALREHLRIIIAVAIGLAPRAIKKAFADRFSDKEQDAARQLSQSAADAVLQSFEVTRKADRIDPSLHSRLIEAAERRRSERASDET